MYSLDPFSSLEGSGFETRVHLHTIAAPLALLVNHALWCFFYMFALKLKIILSYSLLTSLCLIEAPWDVCDMETDECMTTIPCQNGGRYNNTEGSFTCTCLMGCFDSAWICLWSAWAPLLMKVWWYGISKSKYATELIVKIICFRSAFVYKSKFTGLIVVLLTFWSVFSLLKKVWMSHLCT